jgi:hypothetical protein
MNRPYPGPCRHAATTVECAFILPITFLLLLGLVVGAMGVFRYQEVSTLARDAARYGSTHGYQYRKDAGLPIGTSSDWQTDIYNNAIQPNMIDLDSSRLTYQVNWPDVINQPGKPDNWPGSQLTVTINYLWIPEWGPFPTVTMTSTSSMPITN